MRKLRFSIALVAALVVSGCASLGQSLYEADRATRRKDNALLEREVTIGDARGDLKIKLLERSARGEPILLVHGFGGNKDSWNRLAPHLPKAHRLISPTLPGFDDETWDPGRSYDFVSQVDRLSALLSALEVERAHVVGVSMGGALASIFAARHPDQTLSLSAICPAGIEPPEPTPFQVKWRDGDNELIVEEPEQYDRYLDLLFYGPPPDIPGPVRSYLVAQQIAEAPRLKRIDADFRKKPIWVNDIAKDIRAKTLVIWGKQDEILHVSGSTIFEPLEDKKIVRLDGCGHACSFVRAPEVGALVSAHVTRD